MALYVTTTHHASNEAISVVTVTGTAGATGTINFGDGTTQAIGSVPTTINKTYSAAGNYLIVVTESGTNLTASAMGYYWAPGNYARVVALVAAGETRRISQSMPFGALVIGSDSPAGLYNTNPYGGGVGGPTDLTIGSRGASQLQLLSSSGADVDLPLVSTSLAGILTAADKTKIDGLPTSYPANPITPAQLINSLSPNFQLLQRSTAGNLIELHQKDSALFDYQRPTIPSDITPVEIPAGSTAAAAQAIIDAAPANSWFYIRANAGAMTIYQEWKVTPPAGSVFIGERDASGNLLVRLSGAKDIKSGSNSYYSGTIGTNAVYLFTGRSEKPTWVYAPLDGVYIANKGTGYPASGTWTASNGDSGTYTATAGEITSATVTSGGTGSTVVTDNCTITISGGGTGGVLVPVRGDSASSPPSPFKKSTYAPTITIEKSGNFYCCPAVDSLADCQATVFSYWHDYVTNELYINTGTAGAPGTFDYLWLPTTNRAFSTTSTGILNPLAATGRIDCLFTGLILENYWGITLQEGPFFRTPSADMTGWATDSYNIPTRVAVVDCEVRYNSSGVCVGTGGVVRRNYLHHNYDVNISASGGHVYVEGNKIQYGNNCHATWKYNSVWESGNSKFSYSYYCVVVNNLFSDARGKGIWFDLRNDDTLVAFNVCENNTHSGIMYEVSWGGRIISNWCYGNGFMGPVEKPSNAYNNYANIYVSSSNSVEVAYNVIWCRGPVGTEQTNGFGIILELQYRNTERATKRGSTRLITLAPSMWGVQVHHNCTVFPTGVTSLTSSTRAITGFVKDVNWQTEIGYATNTEPLHWLGGPDAGNGNFFYNEFYYVSSATTTNCRHWQVAKQFNGGWNQTIDQVAAITRSVDPSFPHCGQFYGSVVITPGTLPPDPGYQAGSWTPSKKIAALMNTPFVLAAKAH